MSDYRLYEANELGKDGYPPAWHETLKHDVREAAGHRCVRCGHPYVKGAGEWSRCDVDCRHGGPVRHLTMNGAIELTLRENVDIGSLEATRKGRVEARWRILTVHHLDGDKANCRWWNLASLCQRCHLQIQGKVRMERVYPWRHSEWFKPYVAGFYAWSYLGEDLTRPEVEARLDELLWLELAA